MVIDIDEAVGYEKMMSNKTTKTSFKLDSTVSNRGYKKNLHLDDLVETSLNLAVVNTKEDDLEFRVSVRSSILSQQEDLISKLVLLADVLDLNYELSENYPAWEYSPHSFLQDICQSVYQKRTGKSLKVMAVHGGLECGIFKLKVPELDIVALGCNSGDIRHQKSG